MEGALQSAPELGVAGRGHSGRRGAWGSVIASLSLVVECLLNTREPELFCDMGWWGRGGEGQEHVPGVAQQERARLPEGSTQKGGCGGFGLRLGLGLRAGVASRHCSGTQGLPKPSPPQAFL